MDLRKLLELDFVVVSPVLRESIGNNCKFGGDINSIFIKPKKCRAHLICEVIANNKGDFFVY
jgi:hypothetical protein